MKKWTCQPLFYCCLKGLCNLYDTHPLAQGTQRLDSSECSGEARKGTGSHDPVFMFNSLLYLLCQDAAENKLHRQRSHFKPSHMSYSSPVLKFPAVTTWLLLILPLLHSKCGQPWHSKETYLPFYNISFNLYTQHIFPSLLSCLSSLQVGD